MDLKNFSRHVRICIIATSACRAVDQQVLAPSHMSRTMHHLVRRDVVQNEADSLCSVQPGWHRNQFTLRQPDELRVRAADRQRGNYLAWFDSRDTVKSQSTRPTRSHPGVKGSGGDSG